MAMKVRYTVVDGEVLSELRGGVKRDYVPDPLGSTVALLDSSQNITDTFSYWPYGESAGRTGTTPTPFQYVGTMGYYTDSSGRNYVRARYLDKDKGRWVTEDPIGLTGDEWNLFAYSFNNPKSYMDKSGNSPAIIIGIGIAVHLGQCAYCALDILKKWYWNPLHYCNHEYSHCMACCSLTRNVGADCALGAQMGQNIWRYIERGSEGQTPWNRMKICAVGTGFGMLPWKSCHSWCSAKYPNWDNPYNPKNPKCNPLLPYDKKFPPLNCLCNSGNF